VGFNDFWEQQKHSFVFLSLASMAFEKEPFPLFFEIKKSILP
tara:strand:- start:1363 stop:1488 length:126 start_codon:yes stop_codon:yes gene_type:complete